MKRAAFILAVLFIPACGMVWKFSYTFPGTVSVELRADAATQPASQPAR